MDGGWKAGVPCELICWEVRGGVARDFGGGGKAPRRREDRVCTVVRIEGHFFPLRNKAVLHVSSAWVAFSRGWHVSLKSACARTVASRPPGPGVPAAVGEHRRCSLFDRRRGLAFPGTELSCTRVWRVSGDIVPPRRVQSYEGKRTRTFYPAKCALSC